MDCRKTVFCLTHLWVLRRFEHPFHGTFDVNWAQVLHGLINRVVEHNINCLCQFENYVDMVISKIIKK